LYGNDPPEKISGGFFCGLSSTAPCPRMRGIQYSAAVVYFIGVTAHWITRPPG
jgi:hypothetical protein